MLNFAIFFLIDFSTSTSRIQYRLNKFHFSISSSGRFLHLPLLFLLGMHGRQKYLISSLPSFIFFSFKPRTCPTLSRLMGSAIIAAITAVQLQDSGLKYLPKCLDRHILSKAALKAVFVILSSKTAVTTFCGIFSPQARSIIFVSSSSKL